jgi:hypothetical protein
VAVRTVADNSKVVFFIEKLQFNELILVFVEFKVKEFTNSSYIATAKAVAILDGIERHDSQLTLPENPQPTAEDFGKDCLRGIRNPEASDSKSE